VAAFIGGKAIRHEWHFIQWRKDLGQRRILRRGDDRRRRQASLVRLRAECVGVGRRAPRTHWALNGQTDSSFTRVGEANGSVLLRIIRFANR
jgi:hypothetical protein